MVAKLVFYIIALSFVRRMNNGMNTFDCRLYSRDYAINKIPSMFSKYVVKEFHES